MYSLPFTCCLLSFICAGAAPAHALGLDDRPGDPPATASAATPPAAPAVSQDAADDDDDAVLRPLEPDFTLINLPTTLPLPLHKGNFRLTHRFNGNLRSGNFGDQASSLFGIDEGATIGFEYRVAVMKHVEAAAYRTNFDRTIQLYGKYDAFHQGKSMPLGFSAIVSVEGTNNFRQDYAPAIGASISRDVANIVALYAVPMWVHNTAAGTGVTRDTGMVGLGANLKIRPTLFLTGEVTPRLAGYVIGDPEYGFGISKRVGGHVFDLTFTNTTQGTTFAQLARGGFPSSLYFGFNIARKFF
ncbi:MAG TPA: DUF5777 family beta-barrel protein [Vicinamibacterales bacterium]|nr:DUF5777 family beta-barrel protein [Vicinamibacterales bacterium]